VNDVEVITAAEGWLVAPGTLKTAAPRDVVRAYVAMLDGRAKDPRRKGPLHVLQPAVDDVLAASLQRYVDELLRRVAADGDLPTIFRKTPRRRRGERDPRRSQHRCLEVLRLLDLGHGDAKALVADAFGCEVRTVERDLVRWGRRVHKEGWLKVYLHNLQISRLLDP
jgi:hypothetical protein